MKEYFYFTLFILIFGGLAQYNNYRMNAINNINSQQVCINNDKNCKKLNLIQKYSVWILILFLGIFAIQAFRFYVGTDYAFYFNLEVDKNFVIDKFKELDEPLIYLISFIARSIWDHPASNIILMSFLMTVLLFIGLNKYDDNDITNMLLLYAFTGCLLFSFNGVRQALALTFIFAFSKKSEKNWFLKYLIVIFIAFLFHKSALMFLPVLILSNLKINKYQMALIIISGFFIPLFFSYGYEFMGIVDLEDEYITNNINPIRVLVAFAPLILLFFVNKKEFFKDNYFLTNIAVLNAIMTLTTMNSAYLNRFVQYSTIYLISFIPKCLSQMQKKSKIIATIVVMLFYLFYFSYEIYNNYSLRIYHWIFPYISYYA